MIEIYVIGLVIATAYHIGQCKGKYEGFGEFICIFQFALLVGMMWPITILGLFLNFKETK